MNFGLEDHTIERIRSVLHRFPAIDQAILYASRAKGNYRPGSDIDLTLAGADLRTDLLYKLHDALDDELLPYTFNLSILRN